MSYIKAMMIICAYCIVTTCTLVYHSYSTSHRLKKSPKEDYHQEKGFSNATAVEWQKNVHWEPGAELDIYDFLINPVDKCNAGKENITLLVLIKSAPGNYRTQGCCQTDVHQWGREI